MRNIEIGGYIRISKKEAEKRYNAGEIIRLCACKVSPVNVVELKQTIFFAGFFLSWTGKNGAGKLSGVAVRVIGTRFFYSVDDWNREALAAFEIEYFNMGSEWIIDDGEFNPDTDSPLNINGYSVYITAQDEEGIRKELVAVEGCSPSDLVLYVFEGYTRIPQYKAV